MPRWIYGLAWNRVGDPIIRAPKDGDRKTYSWDVLQSCGSGLLGQKARLLIEVPHGGDFKGTTASDFITMSAPSTRVNCGCITTKAREEGANMIIIDVDYHPSFQQIAFMDEKTGECGERQLNHSDGEAEKFYRELKQRGVSVRVGM